MKNLSSWLLAMFMIMFWAFRIVVALYGEKGETLAGFIAFDQTIEIALLFVTILSFILFVKRSIAGGILYLGTYGYYFGMYIFQNAYPAIVNGESMGTELLQNSVVSIIAIILALCTFLDVLIERKTNDHDTSSKSGWFFGNKETDRKIDEKADQNHYKMY